MWAFVPAIVLLGLASIVGVVGVALAASLIAVILASKAIDDGNGYGTTAAATAASLLFPLAALRWSESSSIILMAGLLLVSATMFVLKGLRDGAMVSFSHLLVRALTTGFLLSYLPMIRGLEGGKFMTWSFLLALSGLYLAKRASASGLPARFLGWAPPIAGVASAGLLAVVSLLFLPDSVSLVSVLILGITVGAAGLLGESSERMFSNHDPGAGQIWRGMGPLLFAAPAFFYAFRLYLT